MSYKKAKTFPAEYHPKIWGSETWLVNNAIYCGKLMNLKKQHQCSYHRHNKKAETFHLISGSMLLEVEGDWIALRPGHSIEIHRRYWHKFVGIDDCIFVEISTPHSDKDVERKDGSTRLNDSDFKRACGMYAALIQADQLPEHTTE